MRADVSSAVARHRLYGLMGRLLVEGPVPEAVRTARQLPALASAFERTDDELHVAFYRSVIEGGVAHQSVWTDPSGRIGGAVSAEVQHSYASGGFQPALARVAPDHVGLQLAFLSHLCGAEAEAHADGRPDVVETVRSIAASFLDTHLLAWLPCWVLCVEDEDERGWGQVARLALELAAAHRSDVDAPPRTRALPACDSPLQDPKTGLSDWVERWLRPCAVGAWIGSAAVDTLGKTLDIPVGVGSRTDRFKALVFGAVDAGRFVEFVTALADEWERQSARMATFDGLGLDAHVAVWLDVNARTRRELSNLRIRADAGLTGLVHTDGV